MFLTAENIINEIRQERKIIHKNTICKVKYRPKQRAKKHKAHTNGPQQKSNPTDYCPFKS